MQSVAEQDAAYGKDLYKTDPDLCCALRKVQPLADALAQLRRLGHRPAPRRDPQPGHRAGDRLGRQEGQGQGLAAGPLDRRAGRAYIADNGILVNPLVYDGYPSIGCAPCTRRVAPGEDPRSGRWAGTNKTECGIHS